MVPSLATKAKWSQSERPIRSVRGCQVAICEPKEPPGEHMIKPVVQVNFWRGFLLAGSLLLAVACAPQGTIERPDLLPKMTAERFCSLDPSGERLIVTITNQGAPIPGKRPPIATRVVFPARQIFQGGSVSLDIPPGFLWSRNSDYQHIIDIPKNAFEPDLLFTITADYTDVIDEGPNEDNNTATGVCAR
jgi:hypothetical protein